MGSSRSTLKNGTASKQNQQSLMWELKEAQTSSRKRREALPEAPPGSPSREAKQLRAKPESSKGEKYEKTLRDQGMKVGDVVDVAFDDGSATFALVLAQSENPVHISLGKVSEARQLVERAPSRSSWDSAFGPIQCHIMCRPLLTP